MPPAAPAVETPASSEKSSTLTQYLPGALGAAGAALAGLGAYKYLRTPTFSKNPALRAMQEAAQRGYTRQVVKSRPGAFGQWLDRLRNEGNIVYYPEDLRRANAGTLKRTKVPGLNINFADIGGLTGDINVGGKAEEKAITALLGPNPDKATEYKFFNRYAPGAMGESVTLKEVLADLGIRRTSKLTEARFRKLAPKIEARLREKFPEGFLMKETQGVQSGGVFPTEKDNLIDLLDQYRSRDLANVFKKRYNQLLAAPGADTGPAFRAMHQEPGWAGRVLEQMLAKGPESVLVQQKLPLEKNTGLRKYLPRLINNPNSKEIRVHVVRGQAIPELAMSRFDPGMHIFERQKLRDAAAYTQDIIDKLPKKYRSGSFGMDISPIEGGGFRLIESNPGGLRSGVLPAHPFGDELLHRQMTGRWNKPVSLAGGGAAALGGGAAGYGAGSLLKSQLEPKQPLSAVSDNSQNR